MSAAQHPQAPPRALPGFHLAGTCTLLAYGTLAWLARNGHSPSLPAYFALLGAAWLALALAWWTGTRSATTVPVLHVVTWAVAFRCIAFVSPPLLEDDFYRYLWDGRQTAVHRNPYDTTPQDHFNEVDLPPEFDAILGGINYPHLPTIYGPGLQAAFLLSYWIAPGALWPLKLMLIASDLTLAWLLWRMAGRRTLLLYLWCPLSVQETSFTAHPEILGVLWAWMGIWAWRRRKDQATGVFLGLCAATKVTGVLVAPFLLRRCSARAWMLCALTFAAAYLPFWVQGSWGDLPSLVTFAREWEFNSGGFALLKSLLGPALAPAAALALVAAFLVALAWRQPAGNELPRGDWIFGWFFAWTAVVQPWYLLWLLPWVALRPSAAGWTALAAVSLSYATHLHLGHDGADLYGHPGWVRILEYGLVALALATDAVRTVKQRAGPTGKDGGTHEKSHGRSEPSTPGPPEAAAS
jgi:hypothetical protein